METKRTLRELLIILRDNKQHFHAGLCGLIAYLKYNIIITYKEAEILNKFIKEHPTDYYIDSQSNFYFPRYEWEPREKWLDEWIEKLETDNSK